MNDITEFKGEFAWLSNFTPVTVEFRGVLYPSVEHAYMSAKSDNPGWKKFCENPQNSPGEVKRESKREKLVKNWDEGLKVHVMTYVLKRKFEQEPFRTKLLKTGECHIQEGNWWNDRFWGVCLKTGEGKNVLGQIIMSIRQSLRDEDEIVRRELKDMKKDDDLFPPNLFEESSI